MNHKNSVDQLAWHGISHFPTSWIQSRVKYLAKYVNGYPFKPDDWGPTGRPILRIENLTDLNADANRYDGDLPSHYLVRTGDILISWSGSLGVFRWQGEDAWLNQHIFKVQIDCSALSPEYFFWLASWFIGELGRETHGSTMQHLTQDAFGGFPVLLPPKDAQKSIAIFLDSETSRIDALIATKERAIELLAEKRRALITQAVTKGLNPKVPLRDSGLPWLGEIPNHWQTKALKYLANSSPKSFTDGDWVELPHIASEGVRLIQTGNVGIGRFREQGFRYISNESFVELGCTEIFPNDVLICRLDGPVGRACLVPNLGVKMITSVDNTILKVRENVDPSFLVYLFSSDLWLSWIDALCRVGGGFRMRISRSMLGDFRVPVPPFTEQRDISLYIGGEISKLDSLTNSTQDSLDLIRERRAALIAAAVTGGIDVKSLQPSTISA